MEIVKTIDLCKSYGTGNTKVEALKNINLSICQGEFVAVVGASGSGKSTLLHLLGGVDKPSSGKVFVNGVDVYSLSEKELAIFRRRNVGIIFQFYNLVPVLTAEENMLLPLLLDSNKIDKDRFQELINILGLDDRRNHLPNELSGGQQQRVSIGRALAYNPSIVLADEPTGNLDSKNSKEIVDLLKISVKKYNQTLIIITHDLGVVAKIADRIAVMYAGVIIESGTNEEVFHNPKHPYTWGLLKSVPRLDKGEKERLIPIYGTPPDLFAPPPGCPFAPRCDYAMKICKDHQPERYDISDTHYTHCWLQHEFAPKVENPAVKGGAV